ncbi:DUF885 domain-containing protein [Mucilaginibacter hurinus]|uniref:DUF885 domain-containing protein n=1 Tax=Mucilaginibacter hurinus TaxID=2201324 RepID=A0A367GKN5_9SPHI|nr:DUF885 domain-containing protein [Mucilaginibacter hurinus]RCH54037.1 DUF885 domain-containing protein [Mucilaginibacter hurinus]
MIKASSLTGATLLCALLIAPFAAKPQSTPHNKDWVSVSDKYTEMLIELDKKYSPEYGSSQGLAQYDTLVSKPTLANELAQRREENALVDIYKAALRTEPNPHVKQDLEILINSLQFGFRQQDFSRKRKVPFYNIASIVYDGLEILLDDQTPAERRVAAITRLKKYTGINKAHTPLTTILKQRITEQIGAGPNMIYPSKDYMEKELGRNESIIAGIEKLFQKHKLTGWENAYAALKKQVAEFNEWTRTNVVAKGRTDFRLQPEDYALSLEGYGVDIPPAELVALAHAAFADIQNQMKDIAAQIAKKRQLPSADYRDVIRDLKKAQITGDSIMPLYARTLKSIEDIIAREQLLTLPSRPAIIRLATAAETARSPAPHMVPPPFLNNTGQRGVFVLPLNMPPAPGEKEDRYDDFTFEAASWTLTAHEARPGHELQFDKMVEEGVSKARSLYAFNSTNVEGWGLYAEYIIKPHMPLEGQLVSLDYRLLRAARAFLDPELQAGKITPQQAMDILMKYVVQSHAMAAQEVERYTNRSPGQANSYFYGYTKMISLRADAEKALGKKFNALRFHDFILAQGLLPPALIRNAVMQEFIPSELKK